MKTLLCPSPLASTRQEHGWSDCWRISVGASGPFRPLPLLACTSHPERWREAPPAVCWPLWRVPRSWHMAVLSGRQAPAPRLGPGKLPDLRTANRWESNKFALFHLLHFYLQVNYNFQIPINYTHCFCFVFCFGAFLLITNYYIIYAVSLLLSWLILCFIKCL